MLSTTIHPPALCLANEETNARFEKYWSTEFHAHEERACHIARPLAESNQRILLCLPHQDDEVLGSFFFLQQEAVRQHIDLLYITKGNRCKTASLYSDITSVRMLESIKALEGIPIRNRYQWDFEDSQLKESRAKLTQRLETLLSVERYDLVLSTAPNDLTPDHIILGDVLLKLGQTGRLLFYRSTWATFGIHDADYIYTGDVAQKQPALNVFLSQSHMPLLMTLLYSAIESHRAGGAFAPVELFIDATKFLNTTATHSPTELLRWKQAKDVPLSMRRLEIGEMSS